MTHLLIKLLFVIAAIKWGNWRNWKKYYPTMLFFIIGDLFYQFIFYDYPLWEFDDPFPIYGYDTILIISFMLLRYPATVLIYLGRFPTGKVKGILWMLMWVFLFLFLEVLDNCFGLIQYHNGWSIWWSLVMDIIIFLNLKLHHHKPLFSWIFMLVCGWILWILLDVPIGILK